MGNRRREGGKRVLGEVDVEIRSRGLVDAAINGLRGFDGGTGLA